MSEARRPRTVGFVPDGVESRPARPAKRVVPRATAANIKFLTPAEHAKLIADRRAKTAAAAAHTGVATAAPVFAPPPVFGTLVPAAPPAAKPPKRK